MKSKERKKWNHKLNNKKHLALLQMKTKNTAEWLLKSVRNEVLIFQTRTSPRINPSNSLRLQNKTKKKLLGLNTWKSHSSKNWRNSQTRTKETSRLGSWISKHKKRKLMSLRKSWRRKNRRIGSQGSRLRKWRDLWSTNNSSHLATKSRPTWTLKYNGSRNQNKLQQKVQKYSR